MITNNEIKLINSLTRKKERLAHSLFVVEGNKTVSEVVNSTFEIVNIYGIDEHFSAHSKFVKITPNQLERISNYATSSEALAIVKLPTQEDIRAIDKPSILLENINDPGNLGTIIRTADWFGFDQIICSPNSVDCFNPKVVSSAKGSLFRVKVVYMDLEDFIAGSKYKAVATSLNGEELSSSTDISNLHLVFGNESHGISGSLENICHRSIKIPSFNSQAESLNLGISVGVICGLIRL